MTCPVRLPLLFCALFFTCSLAAETLLNVDVIKRAPHNTRSFTQGLFWQDGVLYESSGLYGRSFITRYNADTNAVESTAKISPRLFAEGLTIFNNELFLLTWRAGISMVLDPTTNALKRKLTYSGEGWGLTHDKTHLIMSNGSERIDFRDPETFRVSRSIEVHNRWRNYKNINELEYAQSAIWANVWQTTYILQISPENGRVLGIVHLDELAAENTRSAQRDVLNGIAYDSEQDAFWITGKFWPYRYLVRFNNPALAENGEKK